MSEATKNRAGGAAGREHPQALRRNERGAAVFAHAARHSRRVRLLKLVLPAAAALVAAAFIGYSFLASGTRGTVDLATASIEDGALVMASPELNGFTDDNLPYKMSAQRAQQALGGGNVIELEDIRANVPVDQDTFASIEAASGTFNREKNTLDIDSDVTLSTTSGVTARLRSAKVDIDANDLTTTKPVDITLDGMQIAADSFATQEGGKVFVFDKRVRVTLDPARLGQKTEE